MDTELGEEDGGDQKEGVGEAEGLRGLEIASS